jgi:hypothetical protein
VTNSIRSRPFRRHSIGAVTVIDARVHRSSARNARLAFVLTAVIVGLLAAVIAADHFHPILAVFAGTGAGTVTGVIAWALVRVWPVIRLIWWWLPEISLGVGLVYGWTVVARSTTLPVRLIVVALVVGVPAAVPYLRHCLSALAWCLIVRHRLRVCFAQFIIANRTGCLPLILLARPTPVGERVWIYLRPGLSHADLNNRIDKIAVACHASTVVVERASDRTAGLLRVDVKRREVLTAQIGSPLVTVVDPDAPPTLRPVDDLPTALDLPDVAADPTPAPRPVTPVKPAPTPGTRKPAPAAAASANGTDVEDLSDWI